MSLNDGDIIKQRVAGKSNVHMLSSAADCDESFFKMQILEIILICSGHGGTCWRLSAVLPQISFLCFWSNHQNIEVRAACRPCEMEAEQGKIKKNCCKGFL